MMKLFKVIFLSKYTEWTFKFIYTIDAEIERQIKVLESGGKIESETRGYDVTANKTFKLRGKESAPDYRYMPEPDLPPLIISQVRILLYNST